MHIKKNIPDKDIWVYTGYTWEYLIEYEEYVDALCYTDVLVEGEFILNKRDITLAFRGSSNQRIIDVPATLEKQEIVIYKTY